MRLTKLEATIKPLRTTVIQKRDDGPGVVTEARLQRALKAIADAKAAAEARGAIPAFDWSKPSENPIVERVRLVLLNARAAEQLRPEQS